MNYAEHLRDIYFATKNKMKKQRAKQHLSPVSLEASLNNAYIAYKEFCTVAGIKPKSISGFLRAPVI